jgi:hypothetical protein
MSTRLHIVSLPTARRGHAPGLSPCCVLPTLPDWILSLDHGLCSLFPRNGDCELASCVFFRAFTTGRRLSFKWKWDLVGAVSSYGALLDA